LAAYGSVGGLVHAYAPHSSVALYFAAALCAALAVLVVFLLCLVSGSTSQLGDKWVFRIAAGAAPIPTYILLILLPLDPDVGAAVLDDRVVVALAGLYGLSEAIKDIRDMAANAKKAKAGGAPVSL
jgi:hypothetical protein